MDWEKWGLVGEKKAWVCVDGSTAWKLTVPRSAPWTQRRKVRMISKGYITFDAKTGFTAKWKAGVGPGAMHLLPENRHLDGVSEVLAPQDVLRACDKAFNTTGDGFDYYLNESRPLHQWALDEGLQLYKLPSMRASRQSINVQLATAILRNASTYLKYMDAVRVEADPNKLLMKEWQGMSDRFVMAAFRSRSVVDCCFTSPMTLFTHNKAVTRPMIRSIMDCAENWLDTLDKLDHLGLQGGKPELEGIADAVLRQFPALRGVYYEWWKKEGPALCAAYELATDADLWPLVSAHLRDAAPHMVVTHQAWLDDDAEGVKGLEHAPKTTDKNESMFAHFDHVLRVSQGASVHACLAVAHAQMMKAFETDAGLKARARKNESTARRWRTMPQK